MKIVLVLILSIGLNASLKAQTYIDYYRQGVAAYEQKDYGEFLKNFKSADSLRPNHRVLLYNLAAGYALTNQIEKAFDVLSYRIGFYAVNDFEEDEDFSLLVETDYLNELKKEIQEANISIKTSETAFEIFIEDFHAEGIAFNNKNDRFYITDIRNGWIYSMDNSGNNLKHEIGLKDFGYWSAMGIKFDPVIANRLWVTTSALPNFTGYSDSLKGRSALLAIDLELGELHDVYELEGEHVFGDLIFRKDGSLFVSDSGQPKIYVLDNEVAKLKEFISDSAWWNLQGLALSEDDEFLYVSDYITGIQEVNLRTKEIKPASERNEMLRGSDGIYISSNKLIMLQNGVTPKRVASISLNKSGAGITSSVSYPDNALLELDEPTLGAVVGSYLYYIANSPWAYYDDNNLPIKENWKPIIVNRLLLE